MITRKEWEHRERAGDSPLGHYRIEQWAGWFLFGRWPLYKRQVGVRFSSKPAPQDQAPPSRTDTP